MKSDLIINLCLVAATLLELVALGALWVLWM